MGDEIARDDRSDQINREYRAGRINYRREVTW